TASCWSTLILYEPKMAMVAPRPRMMRLSTIGDGPVTGDMNGQATDIHRFNASGIAASRPTTVAQRSQVLGTNVPYSTMRMNQRMLLAVIAREATLAS